MKASNLLYYKNWVVVGNVSTEGKYAFKIVNALKSAGFNVIGINPKEVLGKGVDESLKKALTQVHVLDLCTNPALGTEMVKIAHEFHIDKVLIQPGAESQEILDFCNNNGIDAVCGCALVELSKRNQKDDKLNN
ncbi:CoA-binding protein [Clostridium luticellarii]|jgi:predicted CoA-binding protein|uniref:CoA-binding protein n=1 Tax=Clostridium luticellarii TaxID=1691940 RepID=UPI002353FA7B|nr:CoA-binding protein [Clostridium luticellarii]MCI1946330.1 CoA-binding protein [Clostridium luticellarii]MCI1969555.1 CoA-binding protein [Clostridium luticellarii]MCI1994733.1 CoA-binding protein [Clostridium luticellarii]MCI2038965.1 CoA-binding protein [Clostridium luticellarii]